MPRRPPLPLASLALALLVVTAGCASLTGDTAQPTTDAGATDDVPTTDAAETDDVPTTATTAMASDETPTDRATGQSPNDTVVRASLVGTTATGANLSAANATETAGALAADLGVPASDVRLRPETGTVEVFDANVSGSALAGALDDLGVAAPGLRTRAGVADATQQATVRTLEARLDVLGIDATVETATVDGRRGVAVTPTDGNASAVRDAVRDRGRVEIVAHFPANGSGESRSVTLLENGDFERVGTAQVGRQNPYVPVTVAGDAAANFSSALVGFGFTDEGVGDCPTDAARADPTNASGHCLYTVHDGDVVYAASLSAGLADTIESGEWEASPRFVMTAANVSAAQELQAHLEAGALPTRLSIPD